MLRESGASSTPRLLGSITDASGILVHPPSRVMTAECVARDTASRSRRRFARGSSLNFPPSDHQRAQGTPGAQCTRSLVCAGVVLVCTRVFTAEAPETSGIPHAMVLRLISRSPRGPGFLAPVVRRTNPRPWRQRRGVRTTRLCRPRQARPSSAPPASTASRFPRP